MLLVSCPFQVYLLGDVGIEEEFDLKGISYLGGPGDADHKVELKAGYAMPHDPDVTPSPNVLCYPMHLCLVPQLRLSNESCLFLKCTATMLGCFSGLLCACLSCM